MNEELELALAYWRTMAPQPKALAYIAAIEAKLKGEDTDAIVVDHELANAIQRGASIARAKGLGESNTVSSIREGHVRKVDLNPQQSRAVTRSPAPGSIQPKRGRKGKVPSSD